MVHFPLYARSDNLWGPATSNLAMADNTVDVLQIFLACISLRKKKENEGYIDKGRLHKNRCSGKLYYTVNVDIFTWYIFSRISHSTVKVQKISIL